jgi:hypothetical protein
MAKKKAKQVISVKKPKIGENYIFEFAGGKLLGRLDCRNEKLEAIYNEPWFTFVVEHDTIGREGATRYPVSIYNIIRKAEDGERKVG